MRYKLFNLFLFYQKKVARGRVMFFILLTTIRVFCIFLLFITYNALRTKCHAENSEFFASVLISRNFAHAKFRENKTLAKWRNHSVVY